MRVETNPGHVEAEVSVPGVTNIPPIEEVTKGVNGTVGGVTGTVEEIPKGIGVEVPLPEVCLVNCKR